MTPNENLDELLSLLGAVVFEANPLLGLATRMIGSEAHKAITGLTPEEAVARRFRFESIVLPEDLPVLVGERNRELGAAQLKEYRYRRPDGSVGWLLDVTRVFGLEGEPRIAGLLVDISEQRRSEASAGVSARQLRESLGRLDVLAVALDLQGRATFCNARVLECTGYEEHEVVGQDWFRFLPPDAQLRQRFDAAMSRGELTEHIESELLTRSGERLTVRWTNTFLHDLEGKIVGTYSIGQDVTEVRRTARALAASEARYRHLFETMQDGFVLVEALLAADGQRDCRFLELNPAFERITEQPARTLLGGNLREVLSEAAAPLSECLWQVAMSGEPRQFELRWSATNRELEVAAYRPEPGRAAAVVVDITERKRLQAQLLQASKLESIGRLAGGIAHDFNNLLTAILGGAELARLRLPAQHQARAELDGVILASERAGRLTSQLLAYARKQLIQPRKVNLGELLTASSELLGRLLSENIELVLQNAPDLWPVWVDPAQLEQVVLNLALNARDAMPSGGTLRLETANVVLDASSAATQREVTPGEYVLLAVSDTGQGIPEAIQSQVFEPFFTTKGSAGTGLGLATCQGIVKQHGGHIWIARTPGGGTTFKVYLPRTQAQDTDEAVEPARAALRKGSETLLVVEDEPLVLEVALKTLRAYGYQVLVARNGADALALALAFQGTIDALVTDVVMPGMTGRELAERLTGLRAGLRVLYMSGYTEDAVVHQGRGDPGVAFLEKPYAPAQLADKVREVLDAGR